MLSVSTDLSGTKSGKKTKDCHPLSRRAASFVKKRGKQVKGQEYEDQTPPHTFLSPS